MSDRRTDGPSTGSPALRRLVVMFDRLGPYHVARLKALAGDFAVTALECFGETEEYAWQKVSAPDSFQRVTLFPEKSANQIDGAELSARVCSALDAARPEAVAIPGWFHPGARAALQWCVSARLPAVLMSESTAHDAPRSVVKEWIKGRIVGLFSAALVGGRAHVDYLRQLGFPSERIFTGYDVVDNTHFARGRTAHCPPAPDAPPTGLFFLASARFIEKKNLPMLLQAYAEYLALATDAPSTDVRPTVSPPTAPWPLVILGDGPLRSALNSQLSTLNLHGHVHLPGFKQYDELPAWYARASAFVHVSTHEPWGLVVNEAMAAGLPVLVSNRCGCAPDLVVEGRNGFTFDPTDSRQLAALMSDMTQRPDREAMGRESEWIISRWNTSAFAAGMRCAVDRARSVATAPSLIGRVVLGALLRS